ncbi:glycosyl hydrolase family 95 catalytic domain-containing protein [Streptomyces iakyrus]|uniref:glycosyl hydrolase family 95 catalytic domain-containing protein n=1 Tax=Streptomyces iakyrus TaxID=68219 RepID=UPI0038168EB6
MNAGFARRTFLRTSAGGLAAVSAVSWTAEAPVAWAAGEGSASDDPYEQAVRDARMEWTALPRDPHLAPYLGNGRLVVRAVAAPGGRGVRLLVGGPGTRSAQSPAGALELLPLGTPTAVRYVLDLWDAELTGRITTTRGTFAFSALVDRHSPTLLLRARAEGGERLSLTTPPPEGPGLPLHTVNREHGDRHLLAASPATATGVGEATLHELLATGTDAAVTRHRAWWHAFHRRGHVSLPERTLQRFHRAQMYTLAAVTDPGPERLADAPALLGPSRHLGIGPVATALEQGRSPAHEYLAGALPGVGSKAGRTEDPVRASGALALWEAHRYTNDPRIVRDLLRPALAGVVGYFSGFLMEGVDGRLHLPVTHSPGQADASDCTHDLSLLRWAVTTLVTVTRRLREKDHRLAHWEDLAARLTQCHTDTSGVMVGAGVRVARSCAQPSHLTWLLPLRQAPHPDADPALARRSLQHWAGMREAWHAGSYATAAAMAAALGDAPLALELLRHLTGATGDGKDVLAPNSLYRHAVSPRAAAPFPAGQALLELLVGAEGDAVQVFPAVPDAWPDVLVAGLLAPGGHVVDAERSAGRTRWVRVGAAEGRPFTLRHGVDGDPQVWTSRPGETVPHRRVAARPAGPGAALVHPAPGTTVIVLRPGDDPDLTVRQVAAPR